MQCRCLSDVQNLLSCCQINANLTDWGTDFFSCVLNNKKNKTQIIFLLSVLHDVCFQALTQLIITIRFSEFVLVTIYTSVLDHDSFTASVISDYELKAFSQGWFTTISLKKQHFPDLWANFPLTTLPLTPHPKHRSPSSGLTSLGQKPEWLLWTQHNGSLLSYHIDSSIYFAIETLSYQIVADMGKLQIVIVNVIGFESVNRVHFISWQVTPFTSVF